MGSKKIILIFTLIVYLYTPFTVHADTDQRCWIEKNCLKARETQFKDFNYTKSIDPSNLKAGFVQNDETKLACNGEKQGQQNVGFCLPVSDAKTKISIGGKNEFTSIGDFLKYIYKYLILVAGILSVIMIMKGGIQYTISGGNSQIIESAKKSIFGAVIGLIIAILSYSVLNLINPNLVKLKEPNTWMLATIPYGECIETDGKPCACRTEGAELKSCQAHGEPGEYTCYPVLAPGTCAELLRKGEEVAMVVAIDYATGGLASNLAWKGLKVGGTFVKNTATQSAEKFIAKYYKIPWKYVGEEWAAIQAKNAAVKTGTKAATLALDSPGAMDAFAVEFGKAWAKERVVKGTYWELSKVFIQGVAKSTLGVAVGGAKLVTVGTAGIIISREFYDLLNPGEGAPGLAGTCGRVHQLQEGDLCNQNTPNACGANYKCVDTNIGFSCWMAGVNIGTCSSGKSGSFCKTQNDCAVNPITNQPYKCVATEVAGFSISECTDGAQNSPCTPGHDSDCLNGKCTYSTGKYICEQSGIGEGQEGHRCTQTTRDHDNGCDAPLFCQDVKQVNGPDYKHRNECVRPCESQSDCVGLYKTCQPHRNATSVRGQNIYSYCE